MEKFLEIDPTQFGLNKRLKLFLKEEKYLTIEKIIKSRIIQKDALKIIEIADRVNKSLPGLHVSLMCRKNICSKSIKLLNEHGIEVRYVE